MHAREQTIEQRQLRGGGDQVLAFFVRLGLGAVEEVRMVAALAQRREHVDQPARVGGAEHTKVTLEQRAVPARCEGRWL